MTKICWHYDLIYCGGTEQSMASLLEIINKKDKLKANLKSYKYQNDLQLWYELLDDIKKEL